MYDSNIIIKLYNYFSIKQRQIKEHQDNAMVECHTQVIYETHKGSPHMGSNFSGI